MPGEAAGTPGVVFDVQQYCLYDGPGIRTTVFLKGCPMRCYWCHNPESQLQRPQVRFSASRCDGCGDCVPRCAEHAIRLRKGEIQWDPVACTHCGECAAACSEGAFTRVGEDVEPAQVVDRVRPDRPFFEASGGGVTISGGEPTAQRDYLLRLLGALRAWGLHTAVETCGYFPRWFLPQMLENVDVFLFDIKHVDDRKHREGTGCGNQVILENFRELSRSAAAGSVAVRIPLIPGFNTDADDIEGIVAFLVSAGFSGEVHLMPCHGLARSKYEAIGRADYRELGDVPPSDVSRIVGQFAARGLETRIHG